MSQNLKPLGYEALIRTFQLEVIPHFCASFFSPSLIRKKIIHAKLQEKHYYPKNHTGSVFEELLFAIKHEGVNLAILKSVFKCIPKKEIGNFIEENKKQPEVRKLWYLYELIFRPLAIANCENCDFVELVDPKKWYTAKPIKSKRHYVVDNLLGNAAFCPMIRKTKKLVAFETKKKALLKKAKSVVIKKHPHKDYAHFFWPNTGSTKTDLERASNERKKRFYKLMQKAKKPFDLNKKSIIAIHNQAVGKGYSERDFRAYQNYLAYDADKKHAEKICRISPKPEDVQELMQALITTYQRMKKSCDPVFCACILSFGLSIIHPFGDGNGRVQLFLLYYLLLNSKDKYLAQAFAPHLPEFFYHRHFNKSIAHFDKPLLGLLRYTLHKKGRLEVHGKSCDLYRYIDFTPMTEFLTERLSQV